MGSAWRSRGSTSFGLRRSGGPRWFVSPMPFWLQFGGHGGLGSSTSNPRPNSVWRLIPLTSHGTCFFLWGVQTSSLHGSSSLRPCSVSSDGSRRGCAPDFFLKPGLAPSFGLFWEVSFWVFSWTYLGRQISRWKFILLDSGNSISVRK
jgi:hypothetical protein